MEEALLARLQANVALAALVVTRVNWLERPPKDALPGVTLSIISSGRAYHHEGTDGLHGARVRVDSWGATYESAKRTAHATRDAIEPADIVAGIAFNRSFQIGERDLGPDDIPGGGKVFRVSQDFRVWWKPA